jgi:hypothetical protein
MSWNGWLQVVLCLVWRLEKAWSASLLVQGLSLSRRETRGHLGSGWLPINQWHKVQVAYRYDLPSLIMELFGCSVSRFTKSKFLLPSLL